MINGEPEPPDFPRRFATTRFEQRDYDLSGVAAARLKSPSHRCTQSPTTTKLYDRTNDEITLDEIERMSYFCTVEKRRNGVQPARN